VDTVEDGPLAGLKGCGGGGDVAVLIERSAELKRDLVDFACSPRMERSLAAAMAEVRLEETEDADPVDLIDRFASRIDESSSGGDSRRALRSAVHTGGRHRASDPARRR
jgi:hypothetical protein